MVSKNKNKIRRASGSMAFDAANIIFMLFITVIMLLPMIHVVSVSFSSAVETNKGGFFLYPRGFSLEGYRTMFQHAGILASYGNSIIYAVGGTVMTLFFTALTAYPLSIREFRLKKAVTIYLMITMFISGGMIPTYLIIRDYGMINTRLVMMLPFCVGTYNVILFRTFFQGISGELRESAFLDGAGDFTVLFHIILPLSKAILSTVGLFTIVGKWNDWFSPLIYLNSSDKYPMQLILRNILNNARYFEEDKYARDLVRTGMVTTTNIKMAIIVVTILPIICIYPFIQKYFVKGVMIGSIKG